MISILCRKTNTTASYVLLAGCDWFTFRGIQYFIANKVAHDEFPIEFEYASDYIWYVPEMKKRWKYEKHYSMNVIMDL